MCVKTRLKLRMFNIRCLQFRNEGVDSSHNPEFTTCEFYAKHLDYTDMLSLTSRLIRQIVKTLHGEEMKVPYQVRGKPVRRSWKGKLQ